MKNIDTSYKIGLDGEKRIVEYFQRLEFENISQRYKTAFGEIDIIAKNIQTIVFCEVKVRKSFTGNEITKKQWERINNSSLIFLDTNAEYRMCETRYDVIFMNSNGTFEHIKSFEID